ncbi:MAG: ketoacyl-ACP synthase III [Syntrophales bacterium]|jgi:3-oxoacyl-[acyl-carrier-protein] synthase-3|nr:ketoacyl-ACP synthase III [Syntrophales bacterium]
MLYLHGIGHFHPENVMSNRFFEELGIGTDDAWIMERVGIRERRTVLSLDYITQTKNKDPRAANEASLYTNAQTASFAAKTAMERAGIKPEDIGLVISGCCAPSYSTPADAAVIAAALGIEAPCFDLNSACTSFGMHVDFLNRMAPERLPRYVLIVQPENITRAMDFSDRSNCVLFGDGTTAAVLSGTVPSRLAFIESDCMTKTSAWDKVMIINGHFRQDGHAVQGFAIRSMTDSVRKFMSFTEGKEGRFLFIGHQANMLALRTVCERAKIADENHWYNVDSLGNTGCAGAPAVLSAHWDELKDGDRVGICLVGAGLTTVQLLLEVDDNRVQQ